MPHFQLRPGCLSPAVRGQHCISPSPGPALSPTLKKMLRSTLQVSELIWRWKLKTGLISPLPDWKKMWNRAQGCVKLQVLRVSPKCGVHLVFSLSSFPVTLYWPRGKMWVWPEGAGPIQDPWRQVRGGQLTFQDAHPEIAKEVELVSLMPWKPFLSHLLIFSHPLKGPKIFCHGEGSSAPTADDKQQDFALYEQLVFLLHAPLWIFVYTATCI